MPGPSRRPKFYKQYGDTGTVPPRTARRIRSRARLARRPEDLESRPEPCYGSVAYAHEDCSTEYGSSSTDDSDIELITTRTLETEAPLGTESDSSSSEESLSSEVESSSEECLQSGDEQGSRGDPDSSLIESPSEEEPMSTGDPDPGWIYDEPPSEEDPSSSSGEDSDSETGDGSRGGSHEDLSFETDLLADGGDLFPGSPVTMGESNTLVMMFYLKHKLTTAALDDLMKLIEAICPKPNRCEKSAYLVKKFFSDNFRDGKPTAYNCCSTCHTMFKDGQTACTRNGCNRGPPIEFYHQDVASQLQRLFAEPMFRDNLECKNHNREAHVIKDVYDGQAYRELTSPGGFLHQTGNITFCLNTDGVSIYKNSSQGSLWPIYLAVNELPANLRFTKKYLILCGFWLSPSKPNIAVFLKPLMEQLNKIYNEGFQVEDAEGNEHTIRGMLLMATVDLQAKAICMMMMQYNGGYGCHNCEDPGKSLGRGRRVWPYVGASTLRTHESIVECVHRSVAENKTVMGVKGASAFLMHAPFNMATGFPPDYMHEALMGVMKTLLDLWLSPTNKTKDFYIGRMMSTLNERMQALKVPDTISHRPRSFLVKPLESK
ncbi:Hypp476 [Branchiostoma lanceolatum]|uniref:Hypp476 protein n=1 Tax=Branchiostoma lanceolatum TaxID=7740 RepID=A0A8J9WDI5_BRALA|nr:Hypp476 [Branchiostoma lanceolatum]